MFDKTFRVHILQLAFQIINIALPELQSNLLQYRVTDTREHITYIFSWKNFRKNCSSPNSPNILTFDLGTVLEFIRYTLPLKFRSLALILFFCTDYVFSIVEEKTKHWVCSFLGRFTNKVISMDYIQNCFIFWIPMVYFQSLPNNFYALYPLSAGDKFSV